MGEKGRRNRWKLYVCDAGNHRIMRWNAGDDGGQCVAGSGKCGADLACLNWPTALDVGFAGDLYIADTYNSRVVRYCNNDKVGQVVTGIDEQGNRLELLKPCGIKIDEAGVLYVSDWEGCSVQKYWLKQSACCN